MELLASSEGEVIDTEVAGTTISGRATPAKSQRQAIAETLQQLCAQEQVLREKEARGRQEQDAFTKSLLKVMHLDTRDYERITAHAQNMTQQNEITVILDRIQALEASYQLAKKDLAAINDKKLRHERVQMEKRRRDGALGPLRERLQQLDPSIRPSSSYRDTEKGDKKQQRQMSPGPGLKSTLPVIGGSTGASGAGAGGNDRKRSSPPNYREVMDAIRKLQKERKAMLDPYLANLKLARLWRSINDYDRALEDYEKACRSLSEKQIAEIPLDEQAGALERERLRKREALQFLFLRALQLKERKEAAVKQCFELLHSILRKQEYIEDEALATPEAVTQSILRTSSLGFLTDLRSQLLQEMLAASPTDAYLLDAVETMHVRRRAYTQAKQLSDRFAKLPEVKRCSLFSSFAEFQCGGR